MQKKKAICKKGNMQKSFSYFGIVYGDCYILYILVNNSRLRINLLSSPTRNIVFFVMSFLKDTLKAFNDFKNNQKSV